VRGGLVPTSDKGKQEGADLEGLRDKHMS